MSRSRLDRRARSTRIHLISALLLLIFLGVGCDQDEAVAPGLPAGEDVLYADDFSPEQEGEWNLEGDEDGQALVLEDQLVLEVNAPNTVHYATLESPAFDDFVVQVDATRLAGSPDSTFGIIFRRTDAQQFYRFALTGTGYFMIERHNEDGTWSRLIPEWEETSALDQGLDQTNRLAVRVDGPAFSVYVNDNLLTEVADGSYQTGEIALSAGTYGQPGLRVAFDNLVVYRP